jgi:hypothetical protein
MIEPTDVSIGDNTPYVVWSTVEVGVGITAGSVATLRPLWHKTKTQMNRWSASLDKRRSGPPDLGPSTAGSSRRDTIDSEKTAKTTPSRPQRSFDADRELEVQ